jgi:hypothetical protein
VLFGFFYLRLRKWKQSYNRGVSFLGAGNEREAASAFEESARQSTNDAQRAVSIAMLGQCLLALGEPGRALELFGSTERSRHLKSMVPAAHQTEPATLHTHSRHAKVPQRPHTATASAPGCTPHRAPSMLCLASTPTCPPPVQPIRSAPASVVPGGTGRDYPGPMRPLPCKAATLFRTGMDPHRGLRAAPAPRSDDLP